MSVGALEHKMGIHAQPTCVMNYDDAIGWLVGEPGRGLNSMFTMMNAERLFVGIQGLGIAEAANQKAATYARERLQGRSLDGARAPVPIIEHPDVRKMLLSGRAFIDAARALATWTAMQMDVASRHPDETVRRDAGGLVALLTPVVKAAFTDLGFETAVMSQQVFGGHGYIREWGMEQYVRDARIAQIYEGTNGVQAMDLVGRKLLADGGKQVMRLVTIIEEDLGTAGPGVKSIAEPSATALNRLRQSTEHLLSRANYPAEIGAAATDYLRLFALVSFGWMWTKMATNAFKAGDITPLHRRKLVAARFFVDRVLPQSIGLEASITKDAGPLMELEPALF
jgi:hypothetical protein